MVAQDDSDHGQRGSESGSYAGHCRESRHRGSALGSAACSQAAGLDNLCHCGYTCGEAEELVKKTRRWRE